MLSDDLCHHGRLSHDGGATLILVCNVGTLAGFVLDDGTLPLGVCILRYDCILLGKISRERDAAGGVRISAFALFVRCLLAAIGYSWLLAGYQLVVPKYVWHKGIRQDEYDGCLVWRCVPRGEIPLDSVGRLFWCSLSRVWSSGKNLEASCP